MYADPSHRKDRVIKLRLDELCAELLRFHAARRHMQPAVLVRLLVERFLMDEGAELPSVERDPLDVLAHSCARREGVVDAVWKQRVIEQYLADKGYEIPAEEHRQPRLVG